MVSSPRIDELKKKFDENPRRYFAPLANEYRKAGDLEQAIQLCRAYLPQQPGHMSGHIVFGQALFESGQFEESKGVFETALTLDPENLIALRHLGDIAHHAGDPTGARQWYQRVLDADPRNEEIAAQIAALDAAAPASTDGAETPAAAAEGGIAGWGDINPEQSSAAPPEGSAGPSAPRVAGATGLELRDSISMPAIPVVAPPAKAPDSVQASAPAAPSLALERDGEGAFAPPSPEAAANGPIEGVERSEEIDLRPRTSPSIETSGAAEPLTARAPDVGDAPPTRDETERQNMQSFGSSNAFGFETMEFVPPARDDEAPQAGSSSPSGFGVPFTGEAAPSEETPAAFVTETMAELYLQQGFTQEALAVYRQLLSRNPADRGLRERVASLEGGSRSSVAAAAVSDEVFEQAHRRQAREPETIRSFFAALMRRRVLQRYEDSDEGRAAGERADAAEEAAYGEALGASNAAPAGGGYEEQAPPAWESNVGAGPGNIDDVDDTPTGDDAHMLDDAFIVPDGVPLPPGVVAHPHEDAPAPAPAAEYSEVPPTADAEAAAPESDTSSTTAVNEAYAAAAYYPSESAPSAPQVEEGTIDLLFGSTNASSEDERAASLLSGAFPTVESQALGGRPAERAKTELSLDHVFREADRKTGRASGGFSFDQFFSDSGSASSKQPQRSTDPGGTAVGGPDLAPDDDVAQFNDWLTGLKKK